MCLPRLTLSLLRSSVATLLLSVTLLGSSVLLLTTVPALLGLRDRSKEGRGGGVSVPVGLV